MIILWAERLARKGGREAVTMQDLMQTRDDYFSYFGTAGTLPGMNPETTAAQAPLAAAQLN